MLMKPRRQAQAASAYSTGQHQSVPQRFRQERGGERIVHKEFITNISGTSAFTQALQVPLNPGLFQSFPWLSAIANNYESYRFHALKFCYYTRTGSNIPGSVLIVPDYDASDAAPSSEQIASTYNDMEEDVPWKDICCRLNPRSMNSLGPHKFVRNGGLPATADIKTTDSGNVFLFTVDGTAVNWGKVWVEYDVEFFTPQSNPNGNVQSGESTGTGALTAAAIFGTGLNNVFASSTIYSLTPASGTLTFLQNYSGDFQMQLAGTVITAVSVTGTSTISSNTVINSAATASITAGFINALVGQTLILSATATTITSNTFKLAQSIA